MSDKEYKHVYTGSQVEVTLIKSTLEDASINYIVKDNFESGLRAGFGGGLPGQIQVLVHTNEYAKAKKVIDEALA
ncbi:hypothetical protein GCM10009117_00060 [Gangjinia marincola]|uniref:DUF2007 domain-containing protein n=1 Tax=Gangjinia marincola TaxID=578463 RepID=A0ABP3XSD7_9FLAO